MKMTYKLTIRNVVLARNFVLAGALSLGLSFVSPTFAQPAWIISATGEKPIKLGTLGGGSGPSTFPTGINNTGQVVGSSTATDGQFHAFLTGSNGVGMRDLGTAGRSNGAQGVNDAGQVVGNSNFGAFITGPNGIGMTNLDRDISIRSTLAWGINNTGHVVGEFNIRTDFTVVGDTHAFITGPNGVGLTDLGTLGGRFSSATDVNDSGRVAGYSTTSGGEQHAFITGPNGVGMTDLGTLGGSQSSASGINAIGQVAGSSLTAAGEEHAFITGPNGVGMTDLGTLGGNRSDASGINDAGQVVGYSQTLGGEPHTFVTGPNGVGMTDLNALVRLPEVGYIVRVDGINNLGQIIAVSIPIPEPATYALMLSGLGLIGLIVRRRRWVRGPFS
jgi:probable HAF family extracellular repeat protein